MKESRLTNRFVYNNDPEMILAPARKNMDKFILQGMLGNAFAILSGGIFLSGFLVYLGIDDLYASYASILPNICGMLLIFFSSWIQRQEKRKALVISLSIMSKIFIISVIFVPLFVPQKFRFPVVAFLLIIGHSLGCISGISFNSWFTSLIPQEIKGRFFSVRQIFSVIVSLVLPLLGGFVMDTQKDNPYLGYAILFFFAVVVGSAEIWAFSGISDVKMETVDAVKKTNILRTLSIPLKNKPFIHYTIYVCLFYFFLYLGGSFTQIYMRRYLGLGFTFINACSVISSALQVFVFYRFWGILTDRINSNFTLVFSTSFYILDMLGWALVTQANIVFILPILNALASIAAPAFTIGLFNRRYELIPSENKITYDSFYTCALGIVLFLSPLAAGALRNFFSGFPVVMSVTFGNFKLTFLVAAVLLLLLQIYIFCYSNKSKNVDEKLFTKTSFRKAFGILKECLGKR